MTAATMSDASAAAGAQTIDVAPQPPPMRLMPLRDELTLHEIL
jgi:hypothetical protein